MDIEIDGEKTGQVVFGLFGQIAPKTVENFRSLAACDKGKGKITVVIQGRSAEFSAITSGDELPTGTDCRLVDMTTEDTFRVEALA